MGSRPSLICLFAVSLAVACGSHPISPRAERGQDGGSDLSGSAEVGIDAVGPPDTADPTAPDVPTTTFDGGADASFDQTNSVDGDGVDGPEQHVLTVRKTGTGAGTVTSNPSGITCGSTCAHVYDSTTTVRLSAIASPGSTFVGWAGACGRLGECSVSMTDERAVTAVFALSQHTLTVSTSGNGTGAVTSSPAGIDCGATCAHAYDDLTSVTLTASPGTGSTFSGWSGGGCSGTGTCAVSMTEATAVTARFTLSKHILTVGTNGNGRGTVVSDPPSISCGAVCASSYDYLSEVTLTASPSTGSSFLGWSGGGCSGAGACTVTIASAILVTATFSQNEYTLSVTTSGEGSGTVTSDPAGISCGATCAHVYGHGSGVHLAATPSPGWGFKGWSGACSGTSTCIVQMLGDRAVTATFGPLRCTTVGNVTGCNLFPGLSQINLGPMSSTACHDQCESALASAGATSGCWVLAGDGNCYCRNGNLTTGPDGTSTGGTCS